MLIKTRKKKWLFNLSNDPTERKNLASQMPDKVKLLESLLEKHNSQQSEPNFSSIVTFPIRIDKHEGEEWSEDDEYSYWDN